MGDATVDCIPAYPQRYRNFLLACALVTQEQVIEESALAFGGTKNGKGKKAGRKAQSRRQR